MKISFATALPKQADALVLPVAKGAAAAVAVPGASDQDNATIRAAAAASRFEGEAGGVFEAFVAGAGGAARRIVLAGVGQGSAEDLEKAGAALAAKYQSAGVPTLTIVLGALAIAPSAEAVARLASGLVLRNWRQDAYRTKLPEKQKRSLADAVLVGAADGSEAAWARHQAIAQGVSFTRELVTEPANILYPESFVARCEALREHGVQIDVLGRAEMEAAGMGALLGVAQGSVREPKLLVMRWDGSGGTQPTPLVFVGKGVTFDTGGISLKPPAGMEDMKWDMGGAGAVAGAMLALAARKAKAHVVGVCGLVENMPDGNAQRPGDVVTSMSGQTIEVINTDAEGRLVLWDALTGGKKK